MTDGSLHNSSGLATLEEDGSVPSSRMDSALATRSRIQILLNADNQTRAYKRALVKGLVDGNPPYNHDDLVAAGRADMCNVNWRIAEAYLAMALAIRYGMFSDSPTYAVVDTEFGNGVERSDWGAILTEEFDKLQKEDRYFDYEMQCSQFDTVLYGVGPLIFRDSLDWRCRYNPCGMLLVPEMAKSKTEEWEESAIRVYDNPHGLYNYIRYPEAAAKRGWNVEQVKQSIVNSHPRSQEGGQYMNWEWHQQQLKNSSFAYSAESSAIHLGHYFFREFAQDQEEVGRITHVITDLSGLGSTSNSYLYRAERKFADWDEIVHPMYYDHGGGGYHHSTIGMGIKMWGAMMYQNRLLCNMADKVFAPKLLFKPTSANASEQLNMVRFGDYGRVPAGFELLQMPVNGFLDEGLEFNEKVSQVIASNLSQYRQELQKGGNPVTATEINKLASQEATMSTADTNHAYNQMDWLYAEKFRRASNFNLPTNAPGGAMAVAFQNRCLKRGVPKQAIKMAKVTASRIAGAGNAFLRRQTLRELLTLLPRFSEDGQAKLLRDFVAAQGGYCLANRYAPEVGEQGRLPTDQEVTATLQVGNAKQGIAPVISAGQNPVIFAQIFLRASADVLSAVQQAGPQAVPEALAFLETIGPSIGAHLKRIENDPTRAAVFKALNEQFQRMAQLTDKLREQMQKMQQQQQKRAMMQRKAQAMESGADPELRIKAINAATDRNLKGAKVESDIANKDKKAEQGLRIKEHQAKQKADLANQNLAIRDATAAQTIRLQHEKAQAQKDKPKEQ